MQFSLRIIGTLFRLNALFLVPLLSMSVLLFRQHQRSLESSTKSISPESYTQIVRLPQSPPASGLIAQQQAQQLRERQQEIAQLRLRLQAIHEPASGLSAPTSDAPSSFLTNELKASPQVSPPRSQSTAMRQSLSSEPSRAAKALSSSPIPLANPTLASSERFSNWKERLPGDRLADTATSNAEKAEKESTPTDSVSNNPKLSDSLSRNVSEARRQTEASDTKSIEKDTLIRLANDVTFGLVVADRNGQVSYGSYNYRKVQTAIKLLRQGSDISEAAKRSDLTPSVLEQLAEWGSDRPGSFRGNEISYRGSELSF